MTEALLNKPYWVIDILPEQVPKGCPGRYFAVEKYWLQRPMLDDLHRRFTEILLKLNCYYDFQVRISDRDDQRTGNPAPEYLASWIIEEQRDLLILLPGEEALITLNHDDTYMTVYHPSEGLLKRMKCLVSTAGLFLRYPEGQRKDAEQQPVQTRQELQGGD